MRNILERTKAPERGIAGCPFAKLGFDSRDHRYAAKAGERLLRAQDG